MDQSLIIIGNAKRWWQVQLPLYNTGNQVIITFNPHLVQKKSRSADRGSNPGILSCLQSASCSKYNSEIACTNEMQLNS